MGSETSRSESVPPIFPSEEDTDDVPHTIRENVEMEVDDRLSSIAEGCAIYAYSIMRLDLCLKTDPQPIDPIGGKLELRKLRVGLSASVNDVLSATSCHRLKSLLEGILKALDGLERNNDPIRHVPLTDTLMQIRDDVVQHRPIERDDQWIRYQSGP